MSIHNHYVYVIVGITARRNEVSYNIFLYSITA